MQMGAMLVGHEAGKPITVQANQFFRRRTDVYIKERLSQQPLDVGADRIARTAHRALMIIVELGAGFPQPIDLAWEPPLHGSVPDKAVRPAQRAGRPKPRASAGRPMPWVRKPTDPQRPKGPREFLLRKLDFDSAELLAAASPLFG